MDIGHVARLANLPLTSDEEKIYAGQLDNVLGYVDQLRKVDTAKADDGICEMVNVGREDVVKKYPQTISGFVKTQAIFKSHE